MNQPSVSTEAVGAAVAVPMVAAEVALDSRAQRKLSIGRRLEELRGVAAKAAEAESRWEAFKAQRRAAIASMQAENDQLYAEHTDLQARKEAATAEIKRLEAELVEMGK